MSVFYDSMIQPDRSANVFREVIAVCTQELLENVKFFRSPSWAIFPFFLEEGRPPSDEDIQALLMVLEAGDEKGSYRYDRIIILDPDPAKAQRIRSMIEDHLPRLVDERRVFWACVLPSGPDQTESELHRAIGAAIPLM